jgi:hypothetical protein
MIIRLRMLTAVFVIINLLMVSVVTASVAHLPDDHYSAELSIVHSHADHDHQHDEVDHQLHLHMVADLVSFSMIFQARTADAVSSSSSIQLVTLYYSPLLPPPNA